MRTEFLGDVLTDCICTSFGTFVPIRRIRSFELVVARELESCLWLLVERNWNVGDCALSILVVVAVNVERRNFTGVDNRDFDGEPVISELI